MAPPITFTKATLSYPIYSVDFDPYNRGYLVVGGGGGEGRSGVSNKISLLDTTSRSTLDVVTEIELSRNEDSVTSLASLASKDGLITLAGINSSEAEQKAGQNDHLRAFDVRYPKRRRKNEAEEKTDEKAEQGSISAIGKSSLFKPAQGPKPEQYQRLLRLSPAQKSPTGSRRIGAIATGLAKQSQLVIFDATRTPAKQSEIINAIDVDGEVADLDILQTGSQDFSLIWCTDYTIYEQSVQYDFQNRKKELTPRGPRNVHNNAKDDAQKPKVRAKYRSLRFLTDHHLLVLSNLPNKSGAELIIMHLYPTGPAAVVFHKILPSHIKQAVSMDVCALDRDEVGSRQFVVAVAGQDISIEVYTINYTRQTDTFTPFKNFTTLKDVHPLQMTALRFAPFFPPEPAKDQPQSQPIRDQYVRLASVSMGNTIVVDTFALQPLESSKSRTRQVLSHPSTEWWTQKAYVVVASFAVLVIAMIAQSLFFPEQGQAMLQKMPRPLRMILDGSFAATMRDARGRAAQAIPPAEDIPLVAVGKLRDILSSHRAQAGNPTAEQKAVVLRAPRSGSTALDMEIVADGNAHREKDAAAKHWHELEEHEQRSWQETLISAGEWSVDEGEAVLKGILFSSYAGFVGQVAGEAMRAM